ncbi:MAG: DNA repair protein RecN, partial [Bacillota bacterium]|nr:DNA repair protein RecN [Bacillota bacterium]
MKIKNIAVIEEADIDFYDGLNVLTGETGAGKSILIDSISMLTGVRSNRELIRTGEEKASVYGLFKPPHKVWKILEEEGIAQSEDGLLAISRELTVNGKSTCRIAGTPCTLSVLKSIGSYLINIHGQQDALELYAPEKHIILLDKWCADEFYPVLTDYRESYKQYVALAKESRALKAISEKRKNETDFLEFEINEITSAEVKVGEEDKLSERRAVLANHEKISRTLSEAREELFGNSASTREAVATALKKIENILKFDASLEKTASLLKDTLYSLDDIRAEIGGYMDTNGYSEEEMDRISERLDVLHRMKRKYGADEQEILNHLAESEKRLEFLKNSAVRERNLNGELSTLKAQIAEKAGKLHDLREKYGKKLSDEIVRQLEDLNMRGCEFEVNIKKVPYGGLGCDGVEFLISPNSGEKVKPLAKIASGGELSRIMLAIKCIMSES